MLKSVIFDMDGVIIDSEPLYFQWLTDLVKKKGYDVPADELEKTIGLSSAQGRKLLAELCGDSGEIWDEFIDECDAHYIDYNALVNPGIQDFLRYLRKNRIKAGLASATDMDIIQEVLKETGLKQYFDVVLSGEMFFESKPNPEIYIKAMELLDTAPHECIVIEDSEYGIEAGKSAGCYVMAKEEKRFHFDQRKADCIFADFFQILSELSILNKI